MKSIETMIAEYRENVAALTERQRAIEAELRRETAPQVRHALQCRIASLGAMIRDSNRSIWLMRQYLLDIWL